MKLSNYNIILNRYNSIDEKIIYNSFTGAHGLISKSELEEINNYNNENRMCEALRKSLTDGGFLIEDNYDEIEVLRYQALSQRFDDKNISITVAPHSGCNFRCIYCFESGVLNNGIKMSEEIQKELIKYVESKIHDLESLEINWFGGEPTLAMDVVENISRNLISLCKENNVKYDAVMITNGYNINKEIAQSFKMCKISKLQITIDGDKSSHDKRRVLVNGDGTFGKIISNIINFIDDLPIIQLRINIDKTNLKSIDEIKKILKENNVENKVILTLGKVFSDDTNSYSKNVCFSQEEFAEEILKFRNSKNEIGLPAPVFTTCAAENRNNFVLNADGKLYKCWSEIGYAEYSFGDIRDRTLFKGIALKYLTRDITRDDKCSKCSFLPVCMGGCCSIKKEKGLRECLIDKYFIEDQLNKYIDYLLSQDDEQKIINSRYDC